MLEQALELCEVALLDGLRRRLEAGAIAGAHLAQIRNDKLFREAGCDSFRVYCHRHLELSAIEVQRFISLHEVVEVLRAAGLELPENETQVSMLAKIPRDWLVSCWQRVLAFCAREEMVPTHALVKRVMKFAIAESKGTPAVSSQNVAAELGGGKIKNGLTILEVDGSSNGEEGVKVDW